MARPLKRGLDYFPFDCDFFNNEKIVALAGEFGLKGEISAVKLLCAVYRNGYFVEWNEMLKYKLLRELPGVSAGMLEQIVARLVKWGFFDKALFNSANVLTSRGIQRRYFDAARWRKFPEDIPFVLSDVTGVSHEKTGVSHEKTVVSHEKTPQIKRNKIKDYPYVTDNNVRAKPADLGRMAYERIFASRPDCEAFCMNNGITLQQMQAAADEVLSDWALTQPPHRDEHDAREHLINSIRVKLAKNEERSKRAASRGGLDERIEQERRAAQLYAEQLQRTLAESHRPDAEPLF